MNNNSDWKSNTLFQILCIALVLFILPISSFGQGTVMTFGQNRVQFKKFTWSYFETEKFTTYFYLGGQDIGKYAIQFAEKELEKIEDVLEYKMSQPIQILVYNDLSDLNQTNIGLGVELYNIGGVTKILENKMFVYFDGNHHNLEKQIRQGIAQIIINHMMFGGNLQEILQNAVLLNLPTWFTEGLASYIGENWSVELDNKLRDGILSGRYANFDKLAGEDARFAGHAVWHYVEEKYGKSSVPNLLYLTRINRSIESGFLFVLGGAPKSILAEMYNYYYQQFTKEGNNKNTPIDSTLLEKKARKKKKHYEVKLSADKEHVAVATNYLGKYQVRLLNKKTGKSKTIKRGGLKTITLVRNYEYPQMSWSPDGENLAIIYEKKDKLFLMIYNVESKNKIIKPITKFQQIFDFKFTDDPRLLVMSAVSKGQGDIYTYYIPSTKTEQITNDYYDDLDAAYVNLNGRKGIIFSSNRPNANLVKRRMDSVLLTNQFDLYFYDFSKRTNRLIQLTHTPYFKEYQPIQRDDKHFSFLADDNGITNRYSGYLETFLTDYDTLVYLSDSIEINPVWDIDSMQSANPTAIDSVREMPIYKDSAITFPETNYNSNILEHDMSRRSGQTANMFTEQSIYQIYVDDMNSLYDYEDVELTPTFYRQYQLAQAKRNEAFDREKASVTPQTENDNKQDSVLDENTYFFQSDFNTSPQIDVTDYFFEPEIPKEEAVYKFTKIRPYRVKFSTDYVQTQLDNSLIITRYDRFNPGSPVFSNPPISALITLAISDLFENYRITGGLRFPFDFNGSEYFIALELLRKRLDKKVMYYRKVNQNNLGGFESKVRLNYFELRLNYPFDVVKSIRWFAAYRHEKESILAVDDATLKVPDISSNWLFVKTEFVYDNTIKKGLNLQHGLKFKLYAEIHKEIEYENKRWFDAVNIKTPKFNDAYLVVIGADFRHYQKIHKNIIWANRLAWASSFGTRKLAYYLGGVDNWIGAKFDTVTPVNRENGYAFQTISTNMRGFDQNVRNGNSFVVINSELRVPIFTYLFESAIKSEFIRNFQVVGFTDVGTAWEGKSPYENQVFTETISGPVEVKVNFFKNPMVFGYGFGLRSTLLGYFVRFDVAWGNDSGNTTGPKLYFSLSLDF